ncbi:extensin-like [Iris pallida]|uniref:Extensin-like n=1 Tax=Iris pallida TaxID=29817 RepID=A0AAX6G8Y9_IRIPA|nr:extensin-like [Iris pallida]
MKIKYKLHASLLAKVRKLYLASLSIILRGPVLSCSTEGVGVPSYYIYCVVPVLRVAPPKGSAYLIIILLSIVKFRSQ